MSFDDFPLEIIQRVFILCCKTVKFEIPQESHRRRSGTTQVTLSLVCSRWREIALTTSALWGDVVVIYDASSKRAREPTASFQFVRDWLSRAGMSSLSLHLFIRKALESQITATSQTLLSLFHFANFNLSSYESLLFVPANSAPHLKRLRLFLHEPERTTDVFPRLPEMPSLKELHFCFHPGNFVDLTNIYLIPWQQLRVFSLGGSCWSSRVLSNILQRCKSLVECNLELKSKYGQHENNVVLPNPEHLVLDICSMGNADPFIRSLTVTNLKTLDIRSLHSYTRIPLSSEAIVTMAQRSGFKRLTNFSLHLTEQPVDVRSLLGNMPALESVQLYGPLMFQPGTFDDLSSGIIGPRLEEIYFGNITDEEISLMLETVGHRHGKAKTRTDIRPLASVTCDTYGRNLESLNQRAQQCRETFNTHVEIRLVASGTFMAGLMLHPEDSD